MDEPLTASAILPGTLGAALDQWDVVRATCPTDALTFFRAGPGGIRTQTAFSQDRRWPSVDVDRAEGCIRSIANAYSADGGLAVLFGNLAAEGCIVKTAGVDAALLTFTGTARVFESQEDAVSGILGNKVTAGDVVVVRYEGPKGGPGMQEMLYPTTYIKSRSLDRACALLTDGRFSGGSSGLSIDHVSPEAAEGGLIALVRDGDRIVIDIPNRTIDLDVVEAILARRRSEEEARGADAWSPLHRDRVVSDALRAYAAFTTSAARGAVRDLDQVR